MDKLEKIRFLILELGIMIIVFLAGVFVAKLINVASADIEMYTTPETYKACVDARDLCLYQKSGLEHEIARLKRRCE